MRSKYEPITWKHMLVGFVEEVKVDNFHLYGKWLPLDDPVTQEFRAALRAGQQLWVRIGTEETSEILGTVVLASFYQDKIDILHRPKPK